VYACKVGSLDDPHSFLLMEHMPGIPVAQARESLTEDEFHHIEMHLADIVLSLHARTSSTYKKVSDGWEHGTNSYPEFFHSIYDPILHDVVDMKALPPSLKRRVLKIHEKVDGLIQHGDRPRLVHGDLWTSNLLAGKDKGGKWWLTGLLDPNCRFSHVEVELAYLELFKTVTPAFFRAYEQSHRLSSEYRLYRRDVYMMYALLNHVRLFGSQYVKPMGIVSERVAKNLAATRRLAARKVA
jgi:fructosamine-3-kinase